MTVTVKHKLLRKPWLINSIVVAGVFVFSCASLFLSFFLKKLMPSEFGISHGFFHDLEITYKEIVFCLSILLALSLISIVLIFIRPGALRPVLLFFPLLYLLLSSLMVLIDILHLSVFTTRLNFSSFHTMLSSNPREVHEFFGMYLRPVHLLTIGLYAGSIISIILFRRYFVSLLTRHSFLYTSSVFGILGLIQFGQLSHSRGNGAHNVRYWDVVVGEYNEYHAFARKLAASDSLIGVNTSKYEFYLEDRSARSIVLVISESLSRRHLSLYGYSRKTTPRLDSTQHLIRFSDCVTSAALTLDAVPALFNFGHRDKRTNLVEITRQLGYETYWLSNQSAWGKSDGSILQLSRLSAYTRFLDPLADDIKSNTAIHYDEDLLPAFRNVLDSQSAGPKFIVVHLMGCHFDYEKRFPAGREKFTGDPPPGMVLSEGSVPIVNAYDNAILYHDSVVSELITGFKRWGIQNEAALIFLSDHGEEMFDKRNFAGHGYPPVRSTAEIPFFVVLSDKLRAQHPAIEKAVKAKVNTPFSTSNLFFAVLDLLQIKSPKLNSVIPKKAFFNPRYDSTATRLVMGVDYKNMEE
jgi:heptose-I-phosphate ethanolaminephosphotransferase